MRIFCLIWFTRASERARACTHTWIKNQNSKDRRTERDTVTQFVFGCHDRRIVIIFYLNDFGHLMNLLFLLAFHSSSFSAWFVIKSSMPEGSGHTKQKWIELKTFRTVFFSLIQTSMGFDSILLLLFYKNARRHVYVNSKCIFHQLIFNYSLYGLPSTLCHF